MALLGAPNAGKSTLMNRLVGSKVAIVTPKVQTTRHLIRGIQTRGDSQIVYMDTPGIFHTDRLYEKTMVANAWSGAQDSDILLLLVDAARGVDEELRAILARLEKNEKPKALLLNKIDRIKKEGLLALAAEINGILPFDRTFMISALEGQGVEDLQQWLAQTVPQGPWMFPEDQMSDVPLRFLAAEITREKLFLRLQQELPYGLMVDTEQWEERQDGSVKINQVVIVEREAHKKIVLGKNGQLLKAVGQAARREIEQLLDCKVHLFLFVKVIPDWKQKKEFLPVG